MHTITAVFEVKTHEEYGSAGLTMVGRGWADPFDGMAVAHDLLEHGVNDTGTQEEELMALGASLYVRDMEAYYYRKGQIDGNPARNIASGMPDQVLYMLNACKSRWDDPGRVPRCEKDIERIWDQFVDETKKLMRSEFGKGDEIPPAFKESKEFTKAKGWLRKGYHRAEAQYGELRPFQVCALFEQIETKANKFLKHAEPDCGYQCEITVDLKKRTVILQEIYEDDSYADEEEEEEEEDDGSDLHAQYTEGEES